MLATDYPLLNVFLSIFYVFLFVIWFWILISVVIDVFRSEDLGGWGKAFWVFFVIVLPYLGVFVYLIVRGGGMQERKVADMKASQEAMAQYVRETAGTSGASVPEQLERLAGLRERGVLTDEEFADQKAKILG